MTLKKIINAALRKLKKRPASPPVTEEVVSQKPTLGVETVSSQRAAMASLIEVDSYRQLLAGSDPVLNHALGGIELTLAHQLSREVNRPST